MRFHFVKLSIVRIFPKVAYKAKKATHNGTSTYSSKGRSTVMGDKDIMEWSNLKQPSLRRGLTKLVFHASSQPDGI
jgi:hypothetical protein